MSICLSTFILKFAIHNIINTEFFKFHSATLQTCHLLKFKQVLSIISFRSNCFGDNFATPAPVGDDGSDRLIYIFYNSLEIFYF